MYILKYITYLLNWVVELRIILEFSKDYNSFIILASPVSIVWSGSSGPEDLSIKGVDFTCKTSNCVYPAPGNIQWFYKKVFRMYNILQLNPNKFIINFINVAISLYVFDQCF